MNEPEAHLIRHWLVAEKEWVAFVFSYRGKEHQAFARNDAFDSVIIGKASPEEAFDLNSALILSCAVKKIDRNDRDSDGRILIQSQDLDLMDGPRAEGT